jgi:hypothetical protein
MVWDGDGPTWFHSVFDLDHTALTSFYGGGGGGCLPFN